MAVTITRTAWTDDSGTGTDGTVINNAAKTSIYDQIDTALALLLPLAGGTVTGVMTFSAFGTHKFSAGGTGAQSLWVENPTAGTANRAFLGVLRDATTGLNFTAYSSTYTTAGMAEQGGAAIDSNGVGGLSIAASSASGVIRFYSGGTTEWMRLTTDGGLGLKDGITAPATAAGFAVLYVDTADGDLKVKFGDGTVKTISVDT